MQEPLTINIDAPVKAEKMEKKKKGKEEEKEAKEEEQEEEEEAKEEDQEEEDEAEEEEEEALVEDIACGWGGGKRCVRVSSSRWVGRYGCHPLDGLVGRG